jgi:hypothetical protein
VWMFVNVLIAGFPFLGNDFFREAGDSFACHVMDNPDLHSEELLLGTCVYI